MTSPLRFFRALLVVLPIACASVASASHAIAVAPESTGAGNPSGMHARFVQVRPSLYYLDGTLVPAWADFDGDGDPDLAMFSNEGALGFQEIAEFRELLRQGNYHGSSWCDYDKDGLPDIVIVGYGSEMRTLLLHNLGNGRFADVAPDLGMDVAGFGETAVWGDFDGDGWPDLFIPYYAHFPPNRSFLYRNDGQGGFVDIGDSAGVAMRDVPRALKPEGAAAADWDDDGDLDLYVASHLFVNDGNAHFHDERAAAGLPEKFDEGAAFVDYNNDGWPDLYLRHRDTGRLYENANGHFEESSGATETPGEGLPDADLLWGDNWADIDHDGDLDLVYFRLHGPAELMLNRGDGTFDVDSAFLELHLMDGFASFADIDHDGDLDLAAGVLPTTIYLNRLDEEPGFLDSQLRVRVLDANGYRTEQGATVRLRRLDIPSGIQTRIVDGGSGYLTQNEYDVHFGVDPNGLYSLAVSYPSPPGERIVVDEHADSPLGAIRPSDLGSETILVYRDGRAVMENGVLGAPARPASSLAVCPGSTFPNPAHGAAAIRLDLASATRVALTICDVEGRSVRSLGERSWAAGSHTVRWDLCDDLGRTVAPGIYFSRATVGSGTSCVRRFVVVR